MPPSFARLRLFPDPRAVVNPWRMFLSERFQGGINDRTVS
jgi:hypothetical protein